MLSPPYSPLDDAGKTVDGLQSKKLATSTSDAFDFKTSSLKRRASSSSDGDCESKHRRMTTCWDALKTNPAKYLRQERSLLELYPLRRHSWAGPDSSSSIDDHSAFGSLASRHSSAPASSGTDSQQQLGFYTSNSADQSALATPQSSAPHSPTTGGRRGATRGRKRAIASNAGRRSSEHGAYTRGASGKHAQSAAFSTAADAGPAGGQSASKNGRTRGAHGGNSPLLGGSHQDAHKQQASGGAGGSGGAGLGNVRVHDLSLSQIEDYAPPLSSLPPGKSLRAEWKGAPMDLSNDPDLHLLHPAEAHLASVLRLPCEVYLDSKRRLFAEKVHRLKQGLPFRRTDSQKACRIDVNKASRLFGAFEKIGWLQDELFMKFLP